MPWLGNLLLVSLLVMLNLPAIFTGATGMDQYGFFTLDPVAARPWPLALSILLSAAAAGAGYATYRILRKRYKTWYAGNRYGVFHRNAVLFGVSSAVAFAPLFLLTGYNDKPAALAVFGILTACLCLISVLNDRETRLDPAMARLWFAACLAFILVFLILCVAAMLVLYLAEQSPSSGNFFWTWEFAWSDLGYPAEEFSQRHRSSLLAYVLAGSCYLTVAIGGSLMGAILGWVKPAPASAYVAEDAPNEQTEPPPDCPDDGQTPPLEFVVALNGEETVISRNRYESMLAEKDRDGLLSNARILVDKASGTAFAKSGGRWRKLPFRGKRKGPFLLLCLYAHHPGRRFTNSELEMLLKPELPDRDGFNVSDFFSQLQRRNPIIPVQRDIHGSYIPETAGVCYLDHYRPSPTPANGTYDPIPEDEPNPPDRPQEPTPPTPQS